MYLLLSGEGPTDMGVGDGMAEVCEGADFKHGPMALIVDKIVQNQCGHSPHEQGKCGFVSKVVLNRKSKELKPSRKSIRLPGKYIRYETRFFFTNARSLARLAKEKQRECCEEVIAVLFRDADTGNAGRGQWQEKYNSMAHGFEREEFDRGVPMIPKPTSEAWLLCALKKDPYRNCEALENRTSSPKSPHPLKKELANLLGLDVTPELLNEKVQKIDCNRINMPSFKVFKERLEEVLPKKKEN